MDSSYQSLKRGWKCSSQVTDSHSVDVESLRRKSVESPARWECLSSCWSNSNAIIFSEKENLKNKFCFTRSSSGRGTVSSSSSVVGLSQVVSWSQCNCHHHGLVLQGEPCRAEDERVGAAVWERGRDRHTLAGQREVSLGHTGQVGSSRTLLKILGVFSVFREKRKGSQNGELYLRQKVGD